MRVALLQVWTRDGEVDSNLRRGLDLTEQAIDAGAGLVVLPESFTVGYASVDLWPYAEDLDGPTVSAFASLARSGSGIHIIVGLIRRGERGIYNSAVLVGPGGLMGVYDKTHLFVRPSRPKINEIAMFVPGNRLGLFDTPQGRLGVMICYDGHHVEVPRALVLNGAELIVWISNREQLKREEVAYPARLNKVPIAAVVRVGQGLWGRRGDERIGCNGRSWIVDHRGSVLASARGGEEEIVLADVDLQAAYDYRWTDAGLPIYLSRRPDLYGSLAMEPTAHSRRSPSEQ